MESAVLLATTKDVLSPADIHEVHRVVMARSPTPELGGVVWNEQNWIGGSAYNRSVWSSRPGPATTLPGSWLRHVSPADSVERSDAAHVWLRTFASATRRACADAYAFASRIDELAGRWRAGPRRVQRGSAVDLLLHELPGVPLLTVESAAALIDRSEVATSAAIGRLVDAGVLVQRNAGRQRYRVFEAPEVLALFTALERVLAGPRGDTAISEPVRPVHNLN